MDYITRGNLRQTAITNPDNMLFVEVSQQPIWLDIHEKLDRINEIPDWHLLK